MVLVALGYDPEPEIVPELVSEPELEPESDSGAAAAANKAWKLASLLVPLWVEVV